MSKELFERFFKPNKPAILPFSFSDSLTGRLLREMYPQFEDPDEGLYLKLMTLVQRTECDALVSDNKNTNNTAKYHALMIIYGTCNKNGESFFEVGDVEHFKEQVEVLITEIVVAVQKHNNLTYDQKVKDVKNS